MPENLECVFESDCTEILETFPWFVEAKSGTSRVRERSRCEFPVIPAAENSSSLWSLP